MGKVACITGINGQDSSFLAELLLNKGYKIVGLKRRASTNNCWRLKNILKDPMLEIVDGDVSDAVSVYNIIDKYKPNEIYNLAAMSFVAASFEEPQYTAMTNYIGVINVLEAARKFSPQSRIYQASSSELLGTAINENGFQNENTNFIPQSPYAISKLAAHHSCRLYRQAYNMYICCGMLFNHECFKYDHPIIIKVDNDIKIMSIEDIATEYYGFDGINDNKTGIVNNIHSIKVWDENKWTDITCCSWFRNTDKQLKIINARNSVYSVSHDHLCINNENKIIKAEDLQIGDLVKTISYPDINNNNNNNNITLEEAELLGMLVGDGSIPSNYFSNKDEKLRDRFTFLWKKVTNCDTKYYPSVSGFTHKIIGRMQFNNNDWIKKYKIYSNSLDVFGHRYKMIPYQILNSNIDIMEAFLKGYNICDGLKKNKCKYEFKKFKTNSPILAAGLLFLVDKVTNQKINITVEESWKHGKHQFYYSINLLSNRYNNIEKYNKVCELKIRGYSQRKIFKETGISRKFISKVYNGYKPTSTHHLEKINNEIKKIITVDNSQYNNWFFDLETSTGTLHCGLGHSLIHNSTRRGEEFVTRKITKWIGDNYNKIKLGYKPIINEDKLNLGNLDASRDFGSAKDYVEGMYLMLQQEKPDDYIIATGETHTIRELLDVAFNYINIDDWTPYVYINPKFIRPADVPYLRGDMSKTKEKLGWSPKTTFKELIEEMVEADIRKENC